MNVLLFVFTMLMVISLMTYSKIEAFLGQTAIRQEYLCTITARQRDPQNEIQTQQYIDHKGTKKKKEAAEIKEQKESVTKEEPEQTEEVGLAVKASKAPGTQFINIGPLIHEKLRLKNEKKFEDHKLILRRLILYLYGDHSFFQEALEENSNFLEELLQAIITHSEKLSFTKKEVLANVDLKNKQLQQAYARMLRGSTTGACELKGKSEEEKLEILKRSYPSLLEYLTIRKSKYVPIRIATASQELLYAIFDDDDDSVVRILEERDRFTKKVINASKETKEHTKKIASKDFEQMFIDRLPSEFDKDLFSFAITSTRAKK